MKTKSSDGCEIAFDVVGRGNPVVLLHGFSQSRKLWSHFGWPERLGGDCLVIAIDMRGCGQSDSPLEFGRYSVESHIADVDAVMAALDIESCAVWGWSFGGSLALHLAKRGRAISFALIAGTYFGKLFTDQYVTERQESTNDQLTRVRWDGLRSWPGVEPDEIRCPMAVYSGANDGNVVVQLENQRSSIEMAGIDLRVFPGLNHGELLSGVDVVGDYVRSKLIS